MEKFKRLANTVVKTLRIHEMIMPGDRVVMAVSGGPDSVFMLHVIDKLKKRLGVSRIVVCHVDHGIRGGESVKDERFVRALARQVGARYYSHQADILKTIKAGTTIEEAGRNARYDYFAKVAKMTRSNVIATGHTLDDNAETVIMRIIRGASLRGIAGIPPVRMMGKLRVIRPLLCVEKADIVSYLREASISYRTDLTNDETIYYRNKIRHEVIPFLERYNPKVKQALYALAEHVGEDYSSLKEVSATAREGLARHGRKGWVVKIAVIITQPKAVQKEVLREALERSGGDVKRLSFRHWKELELLLRSGRTGDMIFLPGGIRVARTKSVISMEDAKP